MFDCIIPLSIYLSISRYLKHNFPFVSSDQIFDKINSHEIPRKITQKEKYRPFVSGQVDMSQMSQYFEVSLV